MRTKKRSKLTRTLLAACLAATVATSSMTTAFADTGASKNKFFADYNSLAEAQVAAGDVNLRIAQEAQTLLKNRNNALPMAGTERVSVFGVRQDNLVGADGSSVTGGSSGSKSSIAGSLEKAGFKVNPTLRNFYTADNGNIGVETTAFSGEAVKSMDLYNDAAVILFSRTGGEGQDLNMDAMPSQGGFSMGGGSDSEEATQAEQDSHVALAEKNGKKVRHSLMLTKSEQELISYVKGKFNKIIIVLNTSNAMEMSTLQNDDAINAILWMGRPGETGVDAVGQILKGEINPSGRLVDEWMADFTADPSWYNFSYNKQTGSSNLMLGENGQVPSVTLGGGDGMGGGGDKNSYFSVDYEESIYLGYKYYETVYAEIAAGNIQYDTTATSTNKLKAGSATDPAANAKAWHDANVVYPFGYGLSYTTFTMNPGALYKDAALTQALGSSVTVDQFSNSANTKAPIDKLYLPVEVQNTGSVAGKQVVQVYVHAPYTNGGIEKAEHVLVGYAKTDLLQPQAKQTVTVSFNVQDFASWDYNDANNDGNLGDYELDAGTYEVRVMDDSHYVKDDANDKKVTFTLAAKDGDTVANQTADDFSLNATGNVFSNTTKDGKDETFDPNATGNRMYHNSIRTEELMADGGTGMTLLSRADLAGTFPVQPDYVATVSGQTTTVTSAKDLKFNDDAIANWLYYDYLNFDKGGKDQTTDPWYKTDAELETLMTGWTQGDTESDLMFSDMAGVAWDDPKWNELLNKMTWEELQSVIVEGGYGTTAVASIGKAADKDGDGPNNFESTFVWCCEMTIASTWNVELAAEQGRAVANLGILNGYCGWYAPGMDGHRSPFAGRNNEYYSQDAIQGGYIAAAVIKAAESMGITTYIKHCAFNEQETCRDGKVLFVWADEQNLRENYAKIFQMAMQEGGATAAMTGYARIGGIPNTSNYNFLTKLVQEEWGWNGYFVTDGYIGWKEATELDIMVRAGYSLQLKTGTNSEVLSGDWDATLRNGKGSVVIKATADNGLDEDYESKIHYYYTRQSVKSVLYGKANSLNHENGFTSLTYAPKTLAATQFVELGANANIALPAATLGDSSAKYSITQGTLPAGLTLDSATGAISGKATQSGEYRFTVSAVIDGFVKKSTEVKINVAPAFTADGDAFNSYKVGRAQRTQLVTEVFKVGENETYESIEYTLGSGKLPAGLTLSKDGTISGTATEAGVFDIVVHIVATEKKQQGGFPGFPGGGGMPFASGVETSADGPAGPGGGFPGPGGGSASKTEVDYAMQIVVEGDSTATNPDVKIESIEQITGGNGGYKINFSDGTSAIISNGADGEGASGGTAALAVGIIAMCLAIPALAGAATLFVKSKKKND